MSCGARPSGTDEAMVERIVPLGFEIRVEFVLGNGEEIWAQLTRAEIEEIELRAGPDRLRAAEAGQGLQRHRCAARLDGRRR